jgi:hypothetical protein
MVAIGADGTCCAKQEVTARKTQDEDADQGYQSTQQAWHDYLNRRRNAKREIGLDQGEVRGSKNGSTGTFEILASARDQID